MRHSKICTLLLCPPAPLESLFSNRFFFFDSQHLCTSRLCFQAPIADTLLVLCRRPGGIRAWSFTAATSRGWVWTISSLLSLKHRERLAYTVVNEWFGRSFGLICAVESIGELWFILQWGPIYSCEVVLSQSVHLLVLWGFQLGACFGVFVCLGFGVFLPSFYATVFPRKLLHFQDLFSLWHLK